MTAALVTKDGRGIARRDFQISCFRKMLIGNHVQDKLYTLGYHFISPPHKLLKIIYQETICAGLPRGLVCKHLCSQCGGGGLCSIPGQGTRSHMSQLRPGTAK